MDENKNNSAWILCPSKRFPGKFYYYNVLNGEAAWCFNDIEKRYPKKGEKFQQAGQSHNFPEPHTTPEESPNTSMLTKSSVLVNKIYHPQMLSQVPHMLSSVKTQEKSGQPSHMLFSVDNSEGLAQSSHMQSSVKNPEKYNQSSHMLFSVNNSERLGPTSSVPSYINPVQSFGQSSHFLSSKNTERYDQSPCILSSVNVSGRFGQSSNVPSSVNDAHKFGQATYRLSSMNNPDRFRQTSQVPLYMNNLESFNYSSQMPSMNNSENFRQALQIPLSMNNTVRFDHTSRKLSFPKHSVRPDQSTQVLSVNDAQFSYQAPHIHTLDKTSQLQTFGQAVFPSYISKQIPLIPNVIWTPVLMAVTNTPIVEQVLNPTQTSEDIIITLKPCKIPLSERFAANNLLNAQQCVPKTLENTRNKPVEIFDTKHNLWDNSESNMNVISNVAENTPKLVLRKPILNIEKVQTHSHGEDENGNLILTNRKRSFENSNLCKEFKVENKITTATHASGKQDLHTLDLRYVLDAKKKKSNARTCSVKNKIEPVPVSISKKKVSFNIHDSIDDSNTHVKDSEMIYNIISPSDLSELLKNFKQPTAHEIWYIAVDMEVLIDDHIFIENLVRKDAHCKLLIPEAVRRDMKDMCVGEHSANSRVMVARQLYRSLGVWQQHIHVQPFELEEMDMNATEVIVNCCNRLSNENHHVVIITKDDDLYKKAILFNLHVLTMEEINQIVRTNRVNTNKIISIDSKKHENLFLQNTNTFDPFPLSKIKLNPNTFKTLLDINCNEYDTSKINTETEDNVHNITNEICEITAKLSLNDNITHHFTKIKKTIDNSNYKNNNTKSEKVFSSGTNKGQYHCQQLDLKEINCNINQTEKHSNVRDLNLILDRDFTNDEKSAIDEKLKRFVIKYKTSNEIISQRLDECICCYTQIMENCLETILRTDNYSPWSFSLTLDSIRMKYVDHPSVVEIVDNLVKYGELNSNSGYIKININPSALMNTLGCGYLLLEYFKNVIESEDILDAIDALNNLVQNMGKPLEFESPEPTESPVWKEIEDTPRRNFLKDASEIVKYLVEHFPEWRQYEQSYGTTQEQQDLCQQPLILRTCGNIPITIDTNKRIYIDKEQGKVSIKNTIDKDGTQARLNTDIFEHTLHGNTFDSGNNNDMFSPKAIRNFNVVEKIEATRSNSNYDNINNITDINYQDDINNCDKFNNETPDEKIDNINRNDNFNRIADKKFNDGYVDQINRKFEENIDNNDIDSGFENESQQAYHLIRSFLAELSATFKIIYNFIEESIDEFRSDIVGEDAKKILFDKTNSTHEHMTLIIQKLKSIIERETIEGSTLRVLLAKASDASDDKRVTRYRQIVKKCLEQAKILENSLKIILNLTNEDCNVSISTLCDMAYLNIFE